jgi:AraC-like DNA-binding protein
MYLRRLLFVRNNKFQLPWYHYIPFFSLILLAAYFIVFYSPEEYYNLFAEGYMLIIFHVISISMILFNSYYLLRSFKIVSDFKKQEKNVFSFDQSPLTYLYAFLIAFSICLLAWFISLVNSALLDKYFKYVNYESVWVAIPILLYVIGYFSLKQPELFRIPMYPKVNEKKDRLTKMETELLAQKLDSLMLNEQIYLQNDLTLSQVSDLLKSSTNNISWLLNNIYNSTFYDFINGYRIKEFLQKVEKKEHLSHTILALSMDSGFNSKSTFNKAFKREMNDTPSNYIRKRLSA